MLLFYHLIPYSLCLCSFTLCQYGFHFLSKTLIKEKPAKNLVPWPYGYVVTMPSIFFGVMNLELEPWPFAFGVCDLRPWDSSGTFDFGLLLKIWPGYPGFIWYIIYSLLIWLAWGLIQMRGFLFYLCHKACYLFVRSLLSSFYFML